MKNLKLLSPLLCLLFSIPSCKKAPLPTPPPHEVSVVQPIVKDVPVYVDYIGHMVAKISVNVMAQVSGNLTGQYFVEGQDVKQGDLLLVIDPRPFEANLAKAKAVLEENIAKLHYDEDVVVRNTPLVKEDFISQINFDNYVTQVLVDEATIAQNKADIETAQINLGYCYITAPMDCVTGKLQVKPGNYIDANSSTELTILNQIRPILVDFWVPETDIFTIQERQKEGMLQLIVYPDPAHKYAFPGELTLIDNQVNTNTGALLLEGTLPNPDKVLWAGHFVDVRLILSTQKDALLIPSESVMIGQNGHYVYVVNADSTVNVKNVKIGQRYDDKFTSIESGISSEDQIVVGGQLNLYPGMKVEIKNPENPESQTPPEKEEKI